MNCTLSKTEQEILELLWERNQWMSGANFWEYFNKNGKECKRSTVNTYLTRMTEKGLLIKNGTKYIYAYGRKEFEEQRAAGILDDLFNGSLKNFIGALDGGKRISHEEAEELKKYLDQI